MRLGMPESDFPDIRSLEIFAEMDQVHFESLMRGGYVQTFPPHVDLIAEGDPSDFLHIVMSGSIDLFASWNGRDSSLATVRPIATFILAATIRDAPYLMSARTLEKSRVALIPSQDVRAVFDVDSGFARAIVNELSQAYRRKIKAMKDLKLRTSLERLANYLLREQDRCGGAAGFDLPFGKARLASLLGMTPENLSRAFRNLQAYGVTVNGSRISITDQRDLETFAAPSPLIDDDRI
ncbi:MAG: CRP/FNR family transcriptional regulator, transcriptional activator FtrB [Rhodobacteraceae bacterium HLUCCA08]|nr:MAG: CRP/FNR family transcriptional regulator, transcriptional activator FtrB [Rhodobacteraceae bacterium HLUCCA08]